MITRTNQQAAHLIADILEVLDPQGKVRTFLSDEDVRLLQHAAQVLSGEATYPLWMYYETDGDAGYYAIRLFNTKEKAEQWKKKTRSAYGRIDPVGVE